MSTMEEESALPLLSEEERLEELAKDLKRRVEATFAQERYREQLVSKVQEEFDLRKESCRILRKKMEEIDASTIGGDDCPLLTRKMSSLELKDVFEKIKWKANENLSHTAEDKTTNLRSVLKVDFSIKAQLNHLLRKTRRETRRIAHTLKLLQEYQLKENQKEKDFVFQYEVDSVHELQMKELQRKIDQHKDELTVISQLLESVEAEVGVHDEREARVLASAKNDLPLKELFQQLQADEDRKSALEDERLLWEKKFQVEKKAFKELDELLQSLQMQREKSRVYLKELLDECVRGRHDVEAYLLQSGAEGQADGGAKEGTARPVSLVHNAKAMLGRIEEGVGKALRVLFSPSDEPGLDGSTASIDEQLAALTCSSPPTTPTPPVDQKDGGEENEGAAAALELERAVGEDPVHTTAAFSDSDSDTGCAGMSTLVVGPAIEIVRTPSPQPTDSPRSPAEESALALEGAYESMKRRQSDRKDSLGIRKADLEAKSKQLRQEHSEMLARHMLVTGAVFTKRCRSKKERRYVWCTPDLTRIQWRAVNKKVRPTKVLSRHRFIDVSDIQNVLVRFERVPLLLPSATTAIDKVVHIITFRTPKRDLTLEMECENAEEEQQWSGWVMAFKV
eukprot:GCRY01003428.1.p1 GENE.GCRY01003428.1~~GCRY01003428.1.p1  ORF type:complete len:622 (-),score=197.90 GCRY01003428.1:212-2077(-)